MSAEPEPDGPIEMETVACGLCGSTDSRVELRAPDHLHHVPGLFTIVRCTRCGLAFENHAHGLIRSADSTLTPTDRTRTRGRLTTFLPWHAGVAR